MRQMLDNRFEVNFVSKNVVNLSRWNLTGFEISLLSFVPSFNTMDKAKLNPFRFSVPINRFFYNVEKWPSIL